MALHDDLNKLVEEKPGITEKELSHEVHRLGAAFTRAISKGHGEYLWHRYWNLKQSSWAYYPRGQGPRQPSDTQSAPHKGV